jgi:hypothetical protein
MEKILLCQSKQTGFKEGKNVKHCLKEQERYRRFGGTCCVQLPWRWNKYILSKSWYQCAAVYAAIDQNTALRTLSAFHMLNL